MTSEIQSDSLPAAAKIVVGGGLWGFGEFIKVLSSNDFNTTVSSISFIVGIVYGVANIYSWVMKLIEKRRKEKS